MLHFTRLEFQAIQRMIERLQDFERDDTIGCIMKTSGHKLLSDMEVVRLVQKLDRSEAELIEDEAQNAVPSSHL